MTQVEKYREVARQQSGVTVVFRMVNTATGAPNSSLANAAAFTSIEKSINEATYSAFTPSSFLNLGDGEYRVGLDLATANDFNTIDVRGVLAGHSSVSGRVAWDGRTIFRGTVTSLTVNSATIPSGLIPRRGMMVRGVTDDPAYQTAYIDSVSGQAITWSPSFSNVSLADEIEILPAHPYVGDNLLAAPEAEAFREQMKLVPVVTVAAGSTDTIINLTAVSGFTLNTKP